jgi:talin
MHTFSPPVRSLQDLLIYKKRHRPLKVLLVDTTTKMVLIDDAAPMGDLVTTIGKKMNLKNSEEFSLMRLGGEKNEWLNPQKTLAEQGVDENEAVLLKKKWFVTDSSITEDDAVQLHLVYAQGVASISQGDHVLKEDEAIQFAALQCQVQFGNFNAAVHKPGFLNGKLEQMVPPDVAKKGKNLETAIFKEYRSLSGMTETKAKYRYVQLIRSLRAYGMTCYDAEVKPKVVGKKPQPIRLGVTSTHILQINPENNTVTKEHKIGHMRRWAAAPKSFTLDFGDYDDDILTLLTDDGEAISQQIAGYIDILLKKRNDDAQLINEDDMDMATVVNGGQTRGKGVQGQTSSTTGGVGGRAGQMTMEGGAQRGMLLGSEGFQPRSFKIDSLDGAGNAVKTMVGDSQQSGCPQTSNMSVVQWQAQLANNVDGVVAQSGKLVREAEAAPDIDAATLVASAKQLAMNTGNMLAAAHSTAGALGGDDYLLDTARAVAEAVAKLLSAADDVTRNPTDKDKRRALRAAMKQIEDNRAALLACTKGFMTTKADQELLLAAAKAVAEATAALLKHTDDASKSMGNASQRNVALMEAKNAIEAAQSLLNACKTLGPVALDPDCKAQLLRATRKLDGHVQSLTAASKSAGASSADADALLRSARDVSDAIARLLAAADAAEGKPTQNVAAFSDKAKTLIAANQRLAASVGQPPEILKNTKTTAMASGELVTAAKMMAKNAPDETSRKELLEAARRVADATKRLVDDAKNNAQRPHDEAARSRLGESSRGLAHSATQLVGDASRHAAEQALRARAKEAVAATIELSALAKSGKVDTGDCDLDGQLLGASATADDAAGALLAAAAKASQQRDDRVAQQALSDTARRAAPVAFTLVTQCKASGPQVRSAQGRQDLLNAAKNAAEAIKNLLAASKDLAAVSGAAEIETALETLAVEDAAIDSAMLKADSGMLAPDAGAKKPAALVQVNNATNRLGGNTKTLTAAVGSPEKLGAASSAVAHEAVAVTAGARAVASHCEQRTAADVLAKAKSLNQQTVKLMDAATAAAANPNEKSTQTLLLAAAKAVALALADVATACNESEPGSKECEEAASAVLSAAAQLNARNGQRTDFKQASVDLANVTKALSGASTQVSTAATRNKRQLAPAANAVARTYPQLVQAANVAAASAPDAETADFMLQRSQLLAEALAAQLRAAKLASPEDAASQHALQDASAQVTDAVANVLHLCDTTNPGQRELAGALDTVRNALERLNGSAPAKSARSLDDLSRAAGDADKAADAVGAARQHQQLTPSAQAIAKAVDVIADAAKTAASAAEPAGGSRLKATASSKASGASNALADPAARTQEAVRALIAACEAGNQRPALVSSAKTIAMACGELVGAARSLSNELKQSDPNASRQLLGAAQPVANATAKLVQATKVHAQSPSAQAKSENVEAAEALSDAVSALLAAAPFDDTGSASASSSSAAPASAASSSVNALMASARSLAFQVTQLLQASQGVVDQTKVDDAERRQTVADIHTGVAELLVAARDAQPGFKELAQAIASIEASVSELENAAIDADVGILEPPEGRTLPECHQSVAPRVKDMATGLQNVLKSVKTPPAMGAAALSVADALAATTAECKDAAALSSEPSSQLLPATEAGALLLQTLRMLQQQVSAGEIAPVAKQAMEAVVAIITRMRGGGAGGAAIDEAIAAAQAAAAKIDAARDGGRAQRSWDEARGGVTAGVRQLDTALASSFGTGQRDAKNLPPTTRGLGSAVTAIGDAAADVAAHTTDVAARDDFVVSAGQAARALETYLQQCKALFNEPTNAEIRDAFGTANSTVAASLRMLIDSLDNADGGAAACTAAAEALGDVATALSQSALMAAAGSFDETPSAGEFEQAQAALVQTAQAAAQAAAALVGATKAGPAGMAQAANAIAAKAGSELLAQSRGTAAHVGDARGQARLLNAAQDVTRAAQEAVRAAKTAYSGGGARRGAGAGGRQQRARQGRRARQGVGRGGRRDVGGGDRARQGAPIPARPDQALSDAAAAGERQGDAGDDRHCGGVAGRGDGAARGRVRHGAGGRDCGVQEQRARGREGAARRQARGDDGAQRRRQAEAERRRVRRGRGGGESVRRRQGAQQAPDAAGQAQAHRGARRADRPHQRARRRRRAAAQLGRGGAHVPLGRRSRDAGDARARRVPPAHSDGAALDRRRGRRRLPARSARERAAAGQGRAHDVRRRVWPRRRRQRRRRHRAAGAAAAGGRRRQPEHLQARSDVGQGPDSVGQRGVRQRRGGGARRRQGDCAAAVREGERRAGREKCRQHVGATRGVVARQGRSRQQHAAAAGRGAEARRAALGNHGRRRSRV